MGCPHPAGFAIRSPRGIGEPHDIAPWGSQHLSCGPTWTVGRRPARTLRKRDVAQPSNIAIVAYEGEWWKLNLAVRDFLRANADAARNYALAKWHAVSNGADMLLSYSEAKRAIIEMIVAEARVN